MPTIERLSGLEILDSRGRPTVSATCELVGGAVASASVPSGASTGAAEAHELRDGDARRYRGLGCQHAVANVGGEIHHALVGRSFENQADFDSALIALDGTASKSRLGANAILAVSIAFARASAIDQGVPLYAHFASLLGEPIQRLPRMTINLFSGGKHAGGQVPIQDVLVVPTAARSIDEGLVTISAVYQAAVRLIERKYGMRWLTADEGGLAPPALGAEGMLDDAVEAIRDAGLQPGIDVSLAVDVASSHFYQDSVYRLDNASLTSHQMIDRVSGWVDRYPIVSVEDALAEDDWQHWPALRNALGARALVLGDDLLCTNPQRIRRAIDCGACNALLLKVNQIGTLHEALEAHRLARSASWKVTISVRSGDTEDNWFSDLAVGWSGDQSKAGSITQSERLTKYNRLLAIEAELGLPIVNWPASDGAAEPQVVPPRYRMLKTANGVDFGLLGTKLKKPAPTLIVLASTPEETLGSDYFLQCGLLLAKQGYQCVSVDLPSHGQQRRPDEPEGISGWNHRLEAGEDLLGDFKTRLSDVLNCLVATGITDPERIVACGTSRGAFAALHFAASDRRVRSIVSMCQVTDLRVLREFHASEHPERAEALSLLNLAGQLVDRDILVIIGDHDLRVSTDEAIAFARKLSGLAAEKQRPAQIDLRVFPEPAGHTTPLGAAAQAAVWVTQKLSQPR